ncbi:unnamed protein product [Candida verbasci]|uniref:Uncharacterized protein n=1 Tax=Candida verbasci TaxID=1227364 RepID=A0A9W4XFB6_9ASCO|nr:unnamed protein product [Candida verbasci]
MNHNTHGNDALSKLLDSAIAHAEKEKSPDFINDFNSSSSSSSSLIRNNQNPRQQSNINKLIYSISELMELKNTAIDMSSKLPDLTFFKSSIRENHHNNHSHSQYNRKKSRKHNETWERGNRYNKNDDKLNVLEDELEGDPEWNDIGINSSENVSTMKQSVEDFEKWKLQMKLEERRRNGEIIPGNEEEINESVVNAGNEVDNFFSFVNKKTSTSKENENVLIPTPTTGNDSINTNSSTTQTNRSSRFSSFFHHTEQPIENTPEISNNKPLQPPPGFSSKFFGNNNVNKEEIQSQQVEIPPPLNRNESTTSNTSNHSQRQQPSNDSFFMSLLNKKESNSNVNINAKSPISSKETPNNGGLAALFNKNTTNNTASDLPSVVQSPIEAKVIISPTLNKIVPPSPQAPQLKENRKPSTTSTTSSNEQIKEQSKQQQPQQFNQQFNQFPPNQIPPWLRGPPPGLNMKGPAPPPPGFQFPPQQNNPNNAPPPFQQQQNRNMPPMPPPGMFPNGYMPPPNFNPNFPPPPPGFGGPNPNQLNQLPPQFMNQPNRFIPPGFNMNLPLHLQQQQQQQQNQQNQPQFNQQPNQQQAKDK